MIRAVVASALIEGAIAGTRGPGVRKTEAVRHAFETLNLVVGIDQTEEQYLKLEKSLRRGEIVGHAVNLARDLVNTPPAEKSPRHLADRVALVAADAGLSVDIWDEARIRQRAIRRPAGRRRGLGRASAVRRPRLPARG